MAIGLLTTVSKYVHTKIVKRTAICASIIFILILVTPKGVDATHQQDVLGDATVSATPQIPPTVGGPGMLLPDSPIFFLDEAKQDIRVAMAFTPEARAQVYTDIANERLAELRFMLAKNNKKGIRIALEGVYDNFQKAAESLDEAQLSGRNTQSLSKEVNDLLREHQKALDALESQATGVLKAQVAVAQKSLLVSKVSIETHLGPEQLAEEIRYDLQRAGKVVLGSGTKQVVKPSVTPSPSAVKASPSVTTNPSPTQ